jgi:hypothetical protein
MNKGDLHRITDDRSLSVNFSKFSS